jgi:hypothetical protein
MTTAPIDDPSEHDWEHAAKKLEAEASVAREKVVADDADRMWFGEKLQPWSEERQRLLDALTASDVPGPDADVVDDVAFYAGRFQWAVKALYLAHHRPKDWDPVRSRLLSVIDTWGCADYVPQGLTRDERRAYVPERLNVPGDTIAEKAAAVNFVWEMTQAHKRVMAIRRSRRSGLAPDSGNSHSPS